jgi:hypothetical protein
LIIFAKNSRHNLLFLEMKRQDGGKASDEQKEWFNWLHENDYAVGMAKGCDSAIRIFNKYINL